MGQPNHHKMIIQLCWRQTRGTETSHYPEEKKTIVIPLVVASETGQSPNQSCSGNFGVEGPELFD